MQTKITYRLVLAIMAGCFLFSGGCGNLASRGLNADGTRKFEQARYDEAIRRFQQAVEKDPTNADSYYNLASVHHRLATLHQRKTDWDQAESYYNRCLDHNPDHIDGYRGLAVLLNQEGRTDASFRLLQGWADRNPISPEPRIELARLSQETGHADLARARLQEALALDASNARALAALGYLNESTGNTSEALANYQRSLYANRYQPQIASRIASLGGYTSGATSTISTMSQPVGETRMASRGSGTLR